MSICPPGQFTEAVVLTPKFLLLCDCKNIYLITFLTGSILPISKNLNMAHWPKYSFMICFGVSLHQYKRALWRTGIISQSSSTPWCLALWPILEGGKEKEDMYTCMLKYLIYYDLSSSNSLLLFVLIKQLSKKMLGTQCILLAMKLCWNWYLLNGAF